MKKKDNDSKKKRVVTRQVIVSKIYKKFNKALHKRLIQDAVNIICLQLQDNLSKNKTVSVENFGTLSPYLFHEHLGMDVSTGQIRNFSSFRTIKFHPHHNFLFLLTPRRANFLKRE